MSEPSIIQTIAQTLTDASEALERMRELGHICEAHNCYKMDQFVHATGRCEDHQ